MTETITTLALDALHESPFNPRKLFDQAALQQLADDIRAQGRVLQPLLVRPIVPPLFRAADGTATDQDAIAGFEIVFGHRRYRAAAIAGLIEVPCMVRAMTDDEARRAQISENLSRADVHPIEEAEGFQALIDSSSHTADEIAAEWGKSRSYVYGRLKLLQACPEIRRACLEGEIGSEVALLVARLRTPKLQEKALGYIKADYSSSMQDGGKQSYRRVRDLLNEKFALYLKRAMFDPEEEMLLPSAGNCITCPKRSGNAPEYQDVAEDEDTSKLSYGRMHGGPDVCTDPDCYAAKNAAWLKREADKLATEGKTVVTGNAARASISATGQVKGAYVPVSEVKKELAAARLNAQKDSKVVPPLVVLIQDPRTGKTHQVVKRTELAAAGVETPEPKASSSSRYDYAADEAQRKKDRAEAERRTVANVLLFKYVRNQLHGQPLGLEEVRAVAFALLIDYENDTAPVLEVWDAMSFGELKGRMARMDGPDLTRLIMDCVLIENVRVTQWDLNTRPELLLATAARLGIDTEAALLDTPATCEQQANESREDLVTP